MFSWDKSFHDIAQIMRQSQLRLREIDISVTLKKQRGRTNMWRNVGAYFKCLYNCMVCYFWKSFKCCLFQENQWYRKSIININRHISMFLPFRRQKLINENNNYILWVYSDFQWGTTWKLLIDLWNHNKMRTPYLQDRIAHPIQEMNPFV